MHTIQRFLNILSQNSRLLSDLNSRSISFGTVPDFDKFERVVERQSVMDSESARVPEGHGAVRGDLDAIEAHDDVIRLELLGGISQGHDLSHEHSFPAPFELVSLLHRLRLCPLPVHPQCWEARVFSMPPANSHYSL